MHGFPDSESSTQFTPPSSEPDCAANRPREDEGGDLDPSPHEAKRASLPSEGQREKGETGEVKRIRCALTKHTHVA